ncbi:MAG: crossover junction endodeoxyribonuclease RuvC [Candidatus Sumerlaeales bacterium]|nr:crossover junction endodeoxyribonuclease RuvC [Candidatus Sumerlaeales bacterium]
MRIIGIDPGLASTGYGVIDNINDKLSLVECGTIVTTPKDSVARRLQIIHARLYEVAKRTQPDVVSMEGLYFVQNITSGIAVAQGRGVAIIGAIFGTMDTTGIEPTFAEYTPMQIKQAVVGYGKATKAQVTQMVRILLKIKDTDDKFSNHAADALAAAICYAQSEKYCAAIEKAKAAAPPPNPIKPKKQIKKTSDNNTEELSRIEQSKQLLTQMRTRTRRRKRR